MLTDYIKAAMRHACYELLPEGEGFYGHIPELQGVWANADTLEATREELQDVLEEWLVLGLARQHPMRLGSRSLRLLLQGRVNEAVEPLELVRSRRFCIHMWDVPKAARPNGAARGVMPEPGLRRWSEGVLGEEPNQAALQQDAVAGLVQPKTAKREVLPENLTGEYLHRRIGPTHLS